MIDTLTIGGLRGFGEAQTMEFPKPCNLEGSGLTYIVGANNTGKTTIVEAIRSFDCDENNSPSYSPDKRNKDYKGGLVELTVTVGNQSFLISTERVNSGITKTKKIGYDENAVWPDFKFFVLSARRASDHVFTKNEFDISTYLKIQVQNQAMRRQTLTEFGSRLFSMDKHREEIDPMLEKFFGKELQWGIEVTDSNQYYLNISTHNVNHSSEGVGDGIWSIFTICDALRNSNDVDTIIIDEPELSLHPTYQKKLMQLLVEKSKDRQIIVCTHSPYFIDFNALSNGARLFRTKKEKNGHIKVFTLSEKSKQYFQSEQKNLFNPHLCGIDAKELFFLDDNVIVVEGQDDVVYYTKASNDLDIELRGSFYGWGVGGSGNIPKVLNMLSELGYKRVVAIFDGDKIKEKEQAEKEFSEQGYCILNIKTDDIRNKSVRLIYANGTEEIKQIKNGLMDEHGNIKEEHKEEIRALFSTINEYFKK